jgi:hypothetical protein
MSATLWITLLLGLMNVLLGGVLVQIIRNRPVLRKLDTEREANLLHERAEEMVSMRERISALEAKNSEKDREHAEELKRLEAEREARERLYEAEKAIDRHRINNLNTAFQALLMLLKKGVSVEEAVAEVERLRAEQLARETEEAATIRAAAVTAGIGEKAS